MTGERSPNQFIKTTKEISINVGRTYDYTKFTAELTQAVRDVDLVAPTAAPAKPDPTNPIAFEIWMLEVKDHRMKEQEYSNFRAGLTISCLDCALRHFRTSLSHIPTFRKITMMASHVW